MHQSLSGGCLLTFFNRVTAFFIGNLVLILLYGTDASDPIAFGNSVMQSTEAALEFHYPKEVKPARYPEHRESSCPSLPSQGSTLG